MLLHLAIGDYSRPNSVLQFLVFGKHRCEGTQMWDSKGKTGLARGNTKQEFSKSKGEGTQMWDSTNFTGGKK